MAEQSLAAVILAAGQGTRMKSDLPKVLHPVCGRPMLAYVLDACRAAGVGTCYVVVGHRQELVREAFADADDLVWIEQTEQLGTGHAVMMCVDALGSAQPRDTVILCGDGPLIRAETIREVVAQHRESEASVTLATAVIDDPTGYGRIHRDADGRLLGIVEHRDCTPDQLGIREVNPSYYCYRTADLLDALGRITNDNAKGEYYLTDTLGLLIKDGKRAEALTAVPPEDIFSINSRADLARVSAIMRDRINARFMDRGVTIVDPTTTWIDDRAEIGPESVIEPFVHISGAVRIGANCRVGPLVHLHGPREVRDGEIVNGGGAR